MRKSPFSSGKIDLSTREYEYENKLFPVNIVFDSNAVMDWFMGYMTHYGMKPEAMDEFKRFQADVLNTLIQNKPYDLGLEGSPLYLINHRALSLKIIFF